MGLRKYAIGALLVVLASSCSSTNTAEPPEASDRTVDDESTVIQEDTDAPTDFVFDVNQLSPQVLDFCSVEGEVYDLEIVEDIVYFVGAFDSVIAGDGSVHDAQGVGACSREGEIVASHLPRIPGTIRSIALLGDKLVIGGKFSLDDPSGDWENFAVISKTGLLQEGWETRSVSGGLDGVYVSRDEQIYVLGSFSSIGGLTRTGVARLDAGGLPDADFDPDLGPAAGYDRVAVFTVLEKSNGQVMLGGDFGLADGEPVPGVVDVDRETGRLIGDFAPELADTNPKDGRVQVRRILEEGEDIYLCGDWWTTEGRGSKEEQTNMGRFSASGKADPTFAPWTDGGVRDCELLGGYLLIGGHFDNVTGISARKLALLDLEDGAAVPIIDADTPKGVQTVVSTGPTLWIGGTFKRLGGEERPGLGEVQLVVEE